MNGGFVIAAADAASGEYLEQFRDAWTAKQDEYHENFFMTWLKWAEPMVTLDTKEFPFHYPTSGASEPLRHIIFSYRAHHEGHGPAKIHVCEGEY